MNRIPVLDMKEIDSLAKDLGFVVRLDTQAQLCMKSTQPPLELVQDSFVHCRPPLS
jgi:hypothetical protein